MDKLYLVTGASGHLGNTVISKLRAAGCEVRALVLPGEENISDCKESFFGDVRDKESLSDFFSNPANNELGYSVTDIAKTLADTVEWLVRNNRIKL